MRTLVLSCPGEQQGSEQGDMKKESLGGESSCILGSQAGPRVGYWNPGTGGAGRRGSGGHLTSCPCVPHRPLLGSVHFLLLVFLKVPLFLGMLGAVLWVNRPLRSSGGKPQENQQPPCSSTFQEQKTLKQKEKAFFSGIDSRQWRLWFLRHRGSPLQELVP